MNLADTRAFEIAAMAGFDCLWTDMEHVANDWSAVEKQIPVSKAYDTDIMVRMARGSYSDYVRPLELDATGIMVPHIMSAEDARNVVKMTRFYPIGRRPLDGGSADGAYCNIELEKYIEDANCKRFVTVQIEDPEPLEEIDEIASVDGIDMLFFGPGDFSQGIGSPAFYPDVVRKGIYFGGETSDEKVERIMAIEDAIAADFDLYTRLQYGEEGKHYVVNQDGVLESLLKTDDEYNELGLGGRFSIMPTGEKVTRMTLAKKDVPIYEIAFENPTIFKNLYAFTTSAGNKAYEEKNEDIQKIATEFYVNAIIGKVDIENEWDNYLKSLDDSGLQDVLKVFEEVITR